MATDPHPPDRPVTCGAVILAGGTSRRWGGLDKTARPLAAEAVLVRAVRSVLPHAHRLAVVAPTGHPARDAVREVVTAAGRHVVWTREEPPGGGPVAGLAAGLAALSDGSGAGGPDAVLVLAGDLPFAGTAWPRLLAALVADGGVDAVVGLDRQGRRQPLLAVHRFGTLRRRLTAAPVRDQRLRVVTAGLTVVEVPVTDVEALDLDTPQDAARAERIAAAQAGGRNGTSG